MADESQEHPEEHAFQQLGGQTDSEEYQNIQFEQLQEVLEGGEKNVNRYDDVPLGVSIELGRVTEPIRNILEWREGYVVETNKLSGQPMEIMVNGRLFGHGEVVVVGDNLAIRITELTKPPPE